MKKPILFLGLMLLMTAVAFGQIEPTITDLGDIPQTSYADAVCWSDGTDIFCTGGDEDNLYRKYDISEGTWNETGYNAVYYFVIENGDGCKYYDGYSYCPEQNADGMGMYKISGDGSYDGYNLTTSGTGFRLYPKCDLRPTTDEIWCWSAKIPNESIYNVILSYDISDDAWTEIANVNFEPDTRGVQDQRCVFANSNEFWCISGRSAGTPYEFYNDIMVYDIASDTNDQTRTFDVMTGTSHQCWVHTTCGEPIIYCTAQYDDTNDPIDLITDNIYWYNTVTDENGILETGFPYPISIPAIAKLDNTVYVFGGYITSAWEYGQDIFSVEFGAETFECGYSPQHSISDVTGLVIDFGVEFGIQAIALAGIIALVGIAVWIRGRL